MVKVACYIWCANAEMQGILTSSASTQVSDTYSMCSFWAAGNIDKYYIKCNIHKYLMQWHIFKAVTYIWCAHAEYIGLKHWCLQDVLIIWAGT